MPAIYSKNHHTQNKIFIISILLVIILKHHLYAKPPWLVRVELKVEHAAFAATSSSKSHITCHGHPLTHPSQAIPYLFKVPNTISCHTRCPTHRITIPEVSGAGQKARNQLIFFIQKCSLVMGGGSIPPCTILYHWRYHIHQTIAWRSKL